MGLGRSAEGSLPGAMHAGARGVPAVAETEAHRWQALPVGRAAASGTDSGPKGTGHQLLGGRKLPGMDRDG